MAGERISLCKRNGQVAYALIGSEKVELTAGKVDMFYKRLERKLNTGDGNFTITQEDKMTLEQQAVYFGFSLPKLTVTTESKPITDVPTLIMGSSSNNLDLAKGNVKIVKASPYKKGDINRMYFNCVECDTNHNFVYYVDLKSRKRFFKKDNAPRNFVRLDSLAKLEPIFLGLSSEDDMIRKFA